MVLGCGTDHIDSDAREPDADPYCHGDCFGYFECVDGEVWESLHAPVPCDDPAYPYCPKWVDHVCEEGCAVQPLRVDYAYFADPASMCAGAPSKMPGDPCHGSLDCYPPPARVNEYGNLVDTYLYCDWDTNTCVSRNVPWMDNWLASCSAADVFASTGRSGYVFDYKHCWTGVCVFADDPAESCVRQGCSVWCNSDEECPFNSVCDESLVKHDERPGDDRFSGVCKIGPAGDMSLLPCP